MLTEKQKRFVEEYMRTGNSRQAYLNAGYSGSEKSVDVNASRLLNSDKVQAYMEEISNQIKDSKIADIEELQIRLTEIIRGLTTEEVIVTEMIGNGRSKTKVVEKKPSISDVIKAMTLLGRLVGAFKNTANVNLILPVFDGEENLQD